MSTKAPDLKIQDLLRMNSFFTASLLSRGQWMGNWLDPQGRNLDKECGYPQGYPSIETLRQLYDDEGIANRVVGVFADECWAVNPTLYETEDSRVTKFERAWDALLEKEDCNPWFYLHLVDVLSGIGHYGILLLGLDDGLPLDQPVAGIDEYGRPTGSEKERELIYMVPFSEDLVRVQLYQLDTTNPRYGQPIYYEVMLGDPRDAAGSLSSAQPITETWHRIHWSRVIHVADNRKSSRVFGTPRLRPVLKRIFDVRKVAGGSGEMFWRGAFPGYSFETFPELSSIAELDSTSVKEQFLAYSNGLQRYFTLTGMTAKSLAPQVSDPTNTLNCMLMLICATIGVPLPIFLGQVEGHMAGIQNSGFWNKRLAKRQELYITPYLIRQFTNRLCAVGVLPEVKQYKVSWRDLNSVSDKDKADIALKKAQSILQYVTSGSFALVPPKEFMTLVLGWTMDEADAVIEAAGGPDKILSYLKEQVSNTAGLTPASSGVNPAARTGASGHHNGLGV